MGVRQYQEITVFIIKKKEKKIIFLNDFCDIKDIFLLNLIMPWCTKKIKVFIVHYAILRALCKHIHITTQVQLRVINMFS